MDIFECFALDWIFLRITHIDEVFKTFSVVIKNTKNPLVVIFLGFMLTKIVLAKISKEKKFYQTQNVLNPEYDIDSFILGNKKLISQGLTKIVINNLLRFDYISNKNEIMNEVRHISSRYTNEKRKLRKGIGENTTEINKINYSLLELLDQIKSSFHV